MADLTNDQLAGLRKMLDERDKELRDALQSELATREENLGAITSDVPDPGDSSFAQLTMDLDNAAVTRDTDELRAVEAARGRMDSGDYGMCANCGIDIPYERLQLQPTAERCTPCQDNFEKTHADMARGPTM